MAAAPTPHIPKTAKKKSGGAVKGVPGKRVKKAKYNLSVQFVRLADDDGSNASSLTRAGAQASVDTANEIWRRNGGDIEFKIHPASNFDGHVRSTLLNHDCILAPGQTSATIASNNNGDLNGDGQTGKSDDAEVLCRKAATKAERLAYGLARADRIVVLSRRGYEKVKWDSKDKHWQFTTSSGGSSSAVASYINMPATMGSGTLFAHEVGHYLHVLHTHGPNTETLAAVRKAVEKWVAKNPDKDPAQALDGDANATGSKAAQRVFDTPPDPASTVWASVFGSACDPDDDTLQIPYKQGGVVKSVTVRPDRSNVMSYFKSCTNLTQKLTKEQLALARKALNLGNRQALWKTKDHGCFKSDGAVGTSVDSEAKLAQAVRTMAACHLRKKHVWPWETLMRDVYRNPAELRPGFVRRGAVAVHPAREKALLDKLLNTPTLE